MTQKSAPSSGRGSRQGGVSLWKLMESGPKGLNTSSSLRHFQQLTSVAYGATSFPRKEANDQRRSRQWNPKDSTPITCE